MTQPKPRNLAGIRKIKLPNDWEERDYQIKLWDFMTAGGKRALAIWHRRAGKDDVALHWAACAAHQRVGNYWHCLPEYEQGRKALWTAVNPHTGRRRIDEAFPLELRETTSENAMFIRFTNGSTWQIVGSDKYNSTVGAGIVGITFSEFALANPSAWGYYRPMLQENDGWALFISTPRGRNHLYDLYNYASVNPSWFCELLTVDDTKALTSEQQEEAREEYEALYGADVGRAQFEQEYLCSFNAAILGAYYGHEIALVRSEGRITEECVALAGRPVHRAWDIGMRDDTSIWWFQSVGSQLFVLDHYAASGLALEHYRDVVAGRRSQHGWADGTDYVPHDAKVREWTNGRTRIETMSEFGLRPMLVPDHAANDGINAVRRTLPLCVFHPRCEGTGIAALEQYRREWDDERKAFRASAVHDWCLAGETPVLTRYGTCRMMDLPVTGEVLTPCGWRRYHSPRITRRSAPLVEVLFADGLTVRCTPDHLFKTASGWTSAECLTSTTQMQSCLTRSRSISMAVFIACFRVRHIIRAAVRSCIAKLGYAHSVPFLPGVTFITATATSETTAWPTWSVFRLRSIDRKRGTSGERAGIHWSFFCQRRELLPRFGIVRRRDGFGTSVMPSGKRAGLNGSAGHWLARLVGKVSTHWFAKAGSRKSIAPRIAESRDLAVASVRPLGVRADVWCLTVPEAECFALANGAVTHNCSHPADAFRYMSMAWRKSVPVKREEVPKSGWFIPPPSEPEAGRAYRRMVL